MSEQRESRVEACGACGETNGHRIDCPTLPDCGCRDDHVSWCPHFKQPAPPPATGLSEEDRARLEEFARHDFGSEAANAVTDAACRALARLDTYEKALGAADELALAVGGYFCSHRPESDGTNDRLKSTRAAYQATRKGGTTDA